MPDFRRLLPWCGGATETVVDGTAQAFVGIFSRKNQVEARSVQITHPLEQIRGRFDETPCGRQINDAGKTRIAGRLLPRQQSNSSRRQLTVVPPELERRPGRVVPFEHARGRRCGSRGDACADLNWADDGLDRLQRRPAWPPEDWFDSRKVENCRL